MKSSIINLESLLDLSAKLNERYDSEFILNSALLTLMGKLKILRGAVLEPDIEQQNFNFLITKGKQTLERIPFYYILSFKELNINSPIESELINAGYKYIIPLTYHNRILSVIVLSEKIDKNELLEDENYYIWLVSIITSISLQNSRNYQSLKSVNISLESRNQLLTTFFEISKDFSTLLTRNQILKMISYRLMGQLMVSRFSMFLKSSDNKFDELITRFSCSPNEQLIHEFSKIEITANISDLRISPRAYEYVEKMNISAISPMVIQGQTKGFVLIGKRHDAADYSAENLLFLSALSNTAISALENERLFQEELAKKQLEKEMELAFDIQKNLLPKKTPEISGYDLKGISLPARMVGGDYFDFVKISDTKTLISIADVSGKGMPAALLMANVQAALRVLAPLNLELNDFIMRINKMVFNNTTSDKFVTFFVGILNSETNEFMYSNAGHNSPILYQNSCFQLLDKGGLILGILEEPFPYESETIILDKDACLVFYTDGVTESMSKRKEEFGDDKLMQLIFNNNTLNSSEIIDKIVLAVDEHSADMPQTDDITVITLKRND